jgi:7-cyano-7-deazaguanine synthase
MENRKSLPAGRQAVVLLSGGLDSATTLYFARSQGYKCSSLIFDYGQRQRKEIAAAKKIAQSANCRWQVVKIRLPWKGSSLLDRKIKIPAVTKSPCLAGRQASHKVTSSVPNTYVPARNIIFLSFALSFAEAIKAEAIFIGAHVQDYSGYPDCRPEFYQAFSKVISVGTKAGVEKKEIKVIVPLINKNKAQIIRLGSRLDVPFELTWSCYQGGRKPCGRCDSCYFRAKGFKDLGIKDPLLRR